MNKEVIFNYLKNFLIILVVVILIIVIIYPFNKEETIEVPNLIEEKEEVIEVVEEYIVVDIKGAVKKPGAYKLKKENRVIDIITKSGGLKSNANTLLINLSKKLVDEMVIIVHTNEEVQDAINKEPEVVYIEKECICPDVQNDACICDFEESPNNELVSLNLASIEELMTLPGIGEAKAKSIITYREKFGFSNITDLLSVNGIGEAAFEKLKDFIML